MKDVEDAEIITTSPVPPQTQNKEQELLTFPEAIREVINGKKITKVEWNNRNTYGYLAVDGHLKINLPEKLSDWIISDGDLKGTDWITL